MGNFIDEFRNSKASRILSEALSNYNGKKVTLMEVCGTHTMSIFRYGIRSILPDNKIKLISGPGCPVCVTPQYFINSAVELSKEKDVIVLTFGDMMRVPGNNESLMDRKALGSDIRVIYSPLDSIEIAKNNPTKKIILLSIGFETTTPIIALTISKANEEKLKNFFVLSANKTIPEALKLLASDESIMLDGFIYPGHVSAVIGTNFYEELLKETGIMGAVVGFEPLDILHGISNIVESINNKEKKVKNLYSRIVKSDGNLLAINKMYEVFEICDSNWRGIGLVKNSGLKINKNYEKFDAWKIFGLNEFKSEEPKGCICGDVLKGKKTPKECGLFEKICMPENPVGACMVSSEGTCAAYYKYGRI